MFTKLYSLKTKTSILVNQPPKCDETRNNRYKKVMQKAYLQNVQFQVRQVYFTSLLFAVRTSKTRGGGGGTPLYKPKRYGAPPRGGVLTRFGLKTGIDSAHWSGVGYDFRGNCGSV